MKNIASSMKSAVSFVNAVTESMTASIRSETPEFSGALKGAIRDAKMAVVDSGLDVEVQRTIGACSEYDGAVNKLIREVKKAVGAAKTGPRAVESDA